MRVVELSPSPLKVQVWVSAVPREVGYGVSHRSNASVSPSARSPSLVTMPSVTGKSSGISVSHSGPAPGTVGGVTEAAGGLEAPVVVVVAAHAARPASR